LTRPVSERTLAEGVRRRGIMGTGKELWHELETLYSKLDYAGLGPLFASDGIHVDPFGRREGREAIVAYFEEADMPFSDMTMETSQLVEEGDTLVAEWTWRATHTGPMAMPDSTEIPPTGKAVELPGVSVLKIRDGKFATDREYWDAAAVMTQLGLLPGT
jgi:steroid delta-isomerase-like uncharacterized protein